VNPIKPATIDTVARLMNEAGLNGREIVEALNAYNAAIKPVSDALLQGVQRELRGSNWGETRIAQVITAIASGSAEQAELKMLREQVSRLEERQQVLLKQIADLSQSVPLESEVATALEQRGALVAEVGTLKARIVELEREIAWRVEDKKQLMGNLAELDKTIATLRAAQGNAIPDEIKDRFIAIHKAWFGVAGAMTPELMAGERASYDSLAVELDKIRTRERGLLEHVQSMLSAVTRSMEKNAEAEDASRAAEESIGAIAAFIVGKENSNG
jgi:DNA repair exonuclease SbcCD ATPase subunit